MQDSKYAFQIGIILKQVCRAQEILNNVVKNLQFCDFFQGIHFQEIMQRK